ncbi:hypothetical protein PMAYCL1PPCAC_16374, partial [Pristionchus mayeri]
AFLAWFICLSLFLFRKTFRVSHTIVGVGLLLAPLMLMRAEFDQLFRIRGTPPLSGIYVYNAYRVSDDEIRFFYMKSVEDNQPLQYWEGERWNSVETICVCPLSTLLSQCTVEAHLAVIHSIDTSTLTLRVPSGSVEREFDLVDVRPLSSTDNYLYPHKFGVCIQPVYYHADWTVFIQFFEFWIASGATKFFIYVHSVTRQVRSVFEYYSKLLGNQVEIISWSDLPVAAKDRGDFSRDPNTRVFRAGPYAAINDCLLRSRWQVKYLAMMDVDEVLIPKPGASLVKRIEEIGEWNPFADTFSLEWRYGMIEVEQMKRRVRTPRNMAFGDIADAKIISPDNVQFDYGRLRKVIVRPERVRIVDIHNTIQHETFPHLTDWMPMRYETLLVNETDLKVLHLR